MKVELLMRSLNILLPCATRFSTFAHTYHAMMHLNSRKLNLQMLVRDCTTVILWGG